MALLLQTLLQPLDSRIAIRPCIVAPGTALMHSQARVHCAQAERSIVRPAETICRAEPISATQLASEVEAAYMESMNEAGSTRQILC